MTAPQLPQASALTRSSPARSRHGIRLETARCTMIASHAGPLAFALPVAPTAPRLENFGPALQQPMR